MDHIDMQNIMKDGDLPLSTSKESAERWIGRLKGNSSPVLAWQESSRHREKRIETYKTERKPYSEHVPSYIHRPQGLALVYRNSCD